MKQRSSAIVILVATWLLACDKPTDSKPASATSATAKEKDSAKGGAGTPTPGLINRDAAKSYAGDEAGATALIKAFIDKKTDRVALTKALRPDTGDFQAIFQGDLAAKAEETYKKMWDAPQFEGIGGKEDQTEAIIEKVSTEDIAAWNDKAKALPGGYEKVKDKFKKGLVVYRFKFVKPGERLGMANDGLIHVNGHWVFVPKPWRALGGD